MAPSSSLPHVTAVCLLQAYNSAHDEGNSEFKAALWNINKARRQRGNGSISALDVREELCARTLLRESTPALTVEGEESNASSEKEQDYYELVDAVDELAELRGQDENDAPAKTNAVAADGLRRRKVTEKEKTKEWTQETSPNEEDRLRRADPVDLFGAFPPRDLLAAQKQAKQALAKYIEAANLARAILETINDDQGGK